MQHDRRPRRGRRLGHGRGSADADLRAASPRGLANGCTRPDRCIGLTGLTQVLAAGGRRQGSGSRALPGGMATRWGAFTPEHRALSGREATPVRQALPPEHVADLIVWLAKAPGDLVLNEAIVTPPDETGWPSQPSASRLRPGHGRHRNKRSHLRPREVARRLSLRRHCGPRLSCGVSPPRVGTPWSGGWLRCPPPRGC
jgi:hypothetical protein